MPKRKKSERVQIGLRMRDDLRSAIEDSAKKRGISMNNEIVSRLEDSFASRVPVGLKSRIDAAADAAGRSQSEEVARRLESSFELQPIKEIFSLVESVNNARPWNEDITSSLMAVGLIDAYLRSIIPQEARDHVTRPRPANQARTETARLDKALELLIKGRRIPAAEDGQ